MKTIIKVLQSVVLSFIFISFSFAADVSMEEKWQNDFEHEKMIVKNAIVDLKEILPSEEFYDDFMKLENTLATIKYDQDDLLVTDLYDLAMHLGQYRMSVNDPSERSIINNATMDFVREIQDSLF